MPFLGDDPPNPCATCWPVSPATPELSTRGSALPHTAVHVHPNTCFAADSPSSRASLLPGRGAGAGGHPLPCLGNRRGRAQGNDRNGPGLHCMARAPLPPPRLHPWLESPCSRSSKMGGQGGSEDCTHLAPFPMGAQGAPQPRPPHAKPGVPCPPASGPDTRLAPPAGTTGRCP